MRGTGGKTGERLEDDPARRGPLSPIGAAAVILSLLLIAGSILFLATRSNSEPPAPIAEQALPTATPSEAEPLTESEAIAIFRDLDELRLAMYRDPDPSLVTSVFMPGTKIAKRVRSELRQLKRDGVSAQSKFENRSLSVERLDDEVMVLNQVVLVTPRFMDEQGNDITGEIFTERQEVEWRLRQASRGWLIASASIVNAKEIRTAKNR